MSVQVICIFHKYPIETKQAMLQTRLNMAFFGTKGQVTPMSIGDLAGIRTHPRFYACADYLQVS